MANPVIERLRQTLRQLNRGPLYLSIVAFAAAALSIPLIVTGQWTFAIAFQTIGSLVLGGLFLAAYWWARQDRPSSN